MEGTGMGRIPCLPGSPILRNGHQADFHPARLIEAHIFRWVISDSDLPGTETTCLRIHKSVNRSNPMPAGETSRDDGKTLDITGHFC